MTETELAERFESIIQDVMMGAEHPREAALDMVQLAIDEIRTLEALAAGPALEAGRAAEDSAPLSSVVCPLRGAPRGLCKGARGSPPGIRL